VSHPDTDAVHAGERPDPADGAVNTRIVQSTTYWFPEMPDGSASGYIYSRYTNPTVEAVEAKIAALEGAERAMLFSSGMAAITSVCLSFLRPGDTLAVQRGVYGGTTALFADVLEGLGIRIHPFDADAGPDLPAGTRLVWMESITNPLLRVADIPVWADAAHAAGARLVVDATFATPLLQRPLELGADVVIHSATKYMNGHSDITAGAVICRAKEDHDKVWNRRRNTGPTLDPTAAYLVGRGLKTLPLRMARHCHNAATLAAALADHPAVAAVHYPGLPRHPDHGHATRLLQSGFGGMVTLDLGSLEAAQSFRRRLRLVTPAASLGGVESLVSLPVETSHAYASADERRRDGIMDGLVRISVGIEDVEDLVRDVLAALGSA
jgi:methionine-gamma-lyase